MAIVDNEIRDTQFRPPPRIVPRGGESTGPVPEQELEQSGDPGTPAQAPIKPAPAPTVKPVATEVDTATETVEGRMNALTAKGSKYTELAAKDASRRANTRGLINSTMSAAAGTEAAIRSALPIAQQDANTFSENRISNQDAENRFLENRQSTNLNIEVNTSNAQLNEHLVSLESELEKAEMVLGSDLKLSLESALNDVRFSDEMKLQMVSTMNNIIRDTQQQIVEIGLSDRTAAQQAAAISRVQDNRDAELAVYQDLLGTFNDWDWGTDFTPDRVTQTQTTPAPAPAPAPAPGGGGGGGEGGGGR